MSGTTTTTGFSTLLLDQTTWDVCLDANGNIAIAAPPYAIAQDVASACRTFLGEVWYDTTEGVPYFSQVLGKFPSLSLVKADLIAAANTVPGVSGTQVFITGFTNRKLTGQVHFTANGTQQVVGF
jgi:hypothetical protein